MLVLMELPPLVEAGSSSFSAMRLRVLKLVPVYRASNVSKEVLVETVLIVSTPSVAGLNVHQADLAAGTPRRLGSPTSAVAFLVLKRNVAVLLVINLEVTRKSFGGSIKR